MKFQPKWLIATCLLGFAGVKWAAVHWQNQQQAQQPAARVQAACEVAKQGCPLLQQAVFRLQGVRNHNTPFQIVAENVPANVQQISVSFQMTAWIWALTALIWCAKRMGFGWQTRCICRFAQLNGMIGLCCGRLMGRRSFRLRLKHSKHKKQECRALMI